MGFTRITASALINEGPTLLYGVQLLTSAYGADIVLYEGQDSVSGKNIMRIKPDPETSMDRKFDPALYLERGLYVSVGSNVTECTLFWLPAGVE